MATTPVAAIVSGQVTDFDMVREALASEYEVLEELGRGGMALVYRAKDRQLEREVAIKVLPFSLAFDAEFVERFQREARTSAQLEHPNIIPIYRVGRSGRVIYFVMKYLRGGALSNILGTRRLSPPEIRRMLGEAGGALGYAAQRGIVHRDIKPDNIMFDEFGHCVLTDFGIAKAASGQKLTGTGMSIGTPHYMSPEQARAQTIDGRSDIYSLGIVAYQCLTGVVPYDGEDSFSIGYKHITEPVPAPHLTTADERRLYDVIRRMLMKDPSDRFQDCEDLIAALHGQPIAPVGAFRNRASAIAAAPAAVAVPAGLAPALGGGGGGVAIASGPSGAPAFASQPTTPIASPTVDRRKQPIGRRASPRRVADRSLALRNDGNSKAWIWILIAVVAGAAAALYYYKSHGFASGEALKSAPSAIAADSLHRSDTLTAGLPAKRDTTRSAGPSATSVADSTLAVPSTPPASSAPAAAGDSGALRISGIPARSEVLIDERPATSAVTRLPVGRHVIAISAPLRNFYVDTVEIRAGETMELTPELTALGAGTPGAAPPGSRLERRQAIREARREAAASGSFSCEPAVNYNAARCFDVRPQPRTATFVPVPAGATGTPTPSVLWVKVSAAGTTEEVRRLRPSSDPVFERAVRQYVETLTWDPAKKDGAAVDAWTQWIFRPAE
jgi:predicted Ser/Thr protein kinase